jgi:hypothetical protein
LQGFLLQVESSKIIVHEPEPIRLNRNFRIVANENLDWELETKIMKVSGDVGLAFSFCSAPCCLRCDQALKPIGH